MENKNPLYEVREITDFRDMMNQSRELFADRPAFKVKSKDGAYENITYREFYDDVRAFGSALWADGYAGKNIAVLGNNSYWWGVTYLAVTCGLGVIVPIDKELMFDDINTILTSSDATLLITDRKGFAKLKSRLAELPEGLTILLMPGSEQEGYGTMADAMERGKKMLQENDPVVDTYWNNPIDPDALAIIIFTSGTSGMAKGVMLSQRNICFDITSTCSVVEMGTEDQLFSVLPMHHTFECTLGFLAPIYCGSCNAFSESLIRMARDMQEIQPTIFFAVPLMLEKMHDRILKSASKQKGGKFAMAMGKTLAKASDAIGLSVSDKIFKEITKAFGGKLRLVIVGAAAVRPDVVKDFKTFGVTSYIGYGLTECAPLVSGNNDAIFTTDSVGVPIPGVEVKIDNPNANGIGEILVKGPNVMLGYYNDEDSTKEAFTEDGWFRTGDLGNIGSDGNIRITGRAKNVIVTSNGKNIYPEEIEYYLNRNPFIAESMVVGSDKSGEDDTVVEAKIFPDLDAIRKHFKDDHEPTEEEVNKTIGKVVREINKKLPNYKNIQDFSIRSSEFVKTTTAKIKRFAEENLSEAKNYYESKKKENK